MFTQYESKDCNIAVQDFTSIMVTAGKHSLKLKSEKTSNTLKNRKIWFDTECFQMRKTLRKSSRKLKKIANAETMGRFTYDCKTYKKLLKQKKLAYKYKLIKEMENYKNSDSKAFWNTLSSLRSLDADNKVKSDAITPEEWLDHFQNLSLENRPDNNAIAIELANLEKNRYSFDKTTLDYAFTIKEVKSVIRQVGTKKASSDDLMLYEMFKTSINIIAPALTKLFNTVLTSEIFPEMWNIAYQIPIFKSGDMFDTNNFRGISITSCLGKMFNKALNNRIQEQVEAQEKLKDTQAAYRHDFSTTDQIFILNSLLNKYVRFGKKKLYVCFVDFKKAFDSIWHTGLLFKLLKNFNIGGKFYGIIKSMYNNSESCVKLKNGITNKFRLQKGIKQGDTLSPYLFNLYLNDINDIFTGEKNTPSSLMDYVIGCLLYADDLCVISESKSGLQHSLHNLYNYCETWKLQLNVKKTKIVIFSTGKNKEQCNFKFGEDSIHVTDSYSYLGINLSSKGKFDLALNHLKEKANKASFVLRSSLYTGVTFQPDFPLKNFDSTIRPIITYASEVWCCDYTKLLVKPQLIDNTPFENVNNKFCKNIMSLPTQASNFGVKAELGRKPLFSFICSQALRYWVRLANMNSDRLLKKAYFSEMVIHRDGGNSWCTFLLKLLDVTGQNQLWKKQTDICMDAHELSKL